MFILENIRERDTHGRRACSNKIPYKKVGSTAFNFNNQRMSSITPTVLWAQRSSADDETKNVIYLTIEAVDPSNTKLDLTSTQLTLTADAPQGGKYNLKIDFFEEISPENSHKNTDNGSHIYLVLRKKTAKEEYWPRLTKEKLKYHYIKTDFDKWVDEDEQDEVAEDEGNDMANMANMMNMGGAGGAGGPGGPGGFDMSQLMGGAGGDGNFDISALASQLGQAGAGAGNPDEVDDEGDEEEEK